MDSCRLPGSIHVRMVMAHVEQVVFTFSFFPFRLFSSLEHLYMYISVCIFTNTDTHTHITHWCLCECPGLAGGTAAAASGRMMAGWC